MELFKTISNQTFLEPTVNLKKLIILYFAKNGIESVRELSRLLGFSVGSISEYVKHLEREGFLSENMKITAKGQEYFSSYFSKFKAEALALSGIIESELGTSGITIAAVASKNSFLIKNIKEIFSIKVELKIFSSTYEAFTKCREAHYYIIGSVPATKLMSFGFDLKTKLELLSARHAIVGHKNPKKLLIVGEDSVSASLYRNSQLFFSQRDMESFDGIEFVDSLYDIISKLSHKEYAAILWDPFIEYVEKSLGVQILLEFPKKTTASQVLIRNNENYLESRLTEKIESEIQRCLNGDCSKLDLQKEIEKFLAGGNNND